MQNPTSSISSSRSSSSSSLRSRSRSRLPKEIEDLVRSYAKDLVICSDSDSVFEIDSVPVQVQVQVSDQVLTQDLYDHINLSENSTLSESEIIDYNCLINDLLFFNNLESKSSYRFVSSNKTREDILDKIVSLKNEFLIYFENTYSVDRYKNVVLAYIHSHDIYSMRCTYLNAVLFKIYIKSLSNSDRGLSRSPRSRDQGRIDIDYILRRCLKYSTIDKLRKIYIIFTYALDLIEYKESFVFQYMKDLKSIRGFEYNLIKLFLRYVNLSTKQKFKLISLYTIYCVNLQRTIDEDPGEDHECTEYDIQCIRKVIELLKI
jgi:hypothetical protein